MKKKQAIKKLTEKFQTYSLQVDAVSSGINGVQAAKALIQILKFETPESTTPKVVRVSSSYGHGPTLTEAQDDAVIQAVQNLGL